MYGKLNLFCGCVIQIYSFQKSENQFNSTVRAPKYSCHELKIIIVFNFSFKYRPHSGEIFTMRSNIIKCERAYLTFRRRSNFDLKIVHMSLS